MSTFRYTHAAVGGTFDHLHKGHRALLEAAFSKAAGVTIGITTEKLTKKQAALSQRIQSFSLRKKTLETYLKQKKFLKRASFFPLNDVYGSTVTEKSFDAIFITSKTLANARRINERRQKKGYPLLEVVDVPLVTGDDKKIISASSIRLGDIDREGRSSLRFWNKKSVLVLPDSLRSSLQTPFGKVFRSTQNNPSKSTQKLLHYIKSIQPTMVVAVGDIVTASLIENGFTPHLMIIDHQSARKRIQDSLRVKKNAFFVKNDSGTITSQTALTTQTARNSFLKTNKSQQIVVAGEEDLAALPVIMLSPLYSLLVYGQYNLGIIATVIDEETKKKASTLLERFK